jgi:hypothetical protein
VAEYTIIRAVSEGLRDLLTEHFAGYYSTGATIELASPKELGAATTTKRVSLWLYRVARNDFLTNDPPPRPSPGQVARNPLPINLFYLVTPVHTDASTRLEMLGVILQTFNDHSQLFGTDLGIASPLGSQGLRLLLDAPTLEELTQVWYALQESYEVSVAYQAQLVTIESAHQPLASSPVLVRTSEYEEILEVRS